MRHIGIDLHKTTIVVCYLEDEKFSHRTFKIEEIEKFKQSLQLTDELAFESTTNSSWLYKHCENLVNRIVVVNTSAFGVIACSVKKTDKNDAKTLAKYLAKNMLPEIRIKTQSQQELEMLFNARKLLTKQTTMLKNEIHGILLSQGIIIKPYELDSNVGLARVSKLCAGSEVNFALNILIEQLKIQVAKIKEFNLKLEELGSQLPGFANLKSISGLGTNTIVLLLATIGNINNFATSGKLASYLGLVPKVRNSNQSVKHGGVTKQGNSLLRGNLVMCALSTIRKNKILGTFYQHIKDKSGYKKAIMATAHKLVKIIYYTLKHNWYFEDFCVQKRKTLVINW
jgi:transposase